MSSCEMSRSHRRLPSRRRRRASRTPRAVSPSSSASGRSPSLRASILAAFRFHWVAGYRELLFALREDSDDAEVRARIDQLLAEKRD